MNTGKYFGKIEIVFGALCVLSLAVLMVWLMVGDVERMQTATTNYDYYSNFVYLIDNIARTYFFCIVMLMVFFTYVNKQYSKWCIRLFYILGVSTLMYFVIANHFYRHVFGFIETENMEKMPSMTTTLFTGPLYWMIIGYFLIPRILKDAQKLKEEQELTVLEDLIF